MATKGQYAAILVTIILGIMIFIAMSMAAINLKTTLDAYYEENNFADFFVTINSAPESVIEKINKIDGVKSAEGRISGTVPFISKDETERINVKLISARPDEQINKAFLIKGTLIKNNYKDALVLSQFADARGIEIGDEITVQVNGRPVQLQVAGIVANPEFIYLMENLDALMSDATKFGAVYISEELSQTLFGMKGAFNTILIDYDETLIPADDNENEPVIQRILDDIEKEVDGYGIQSMFHKKSQLSNSMVSQEIKQLKNMSNSLPLVFLLVAALILAMMLNRMVKKDRGVIGLFKAIGYSNKDMVIHYTKYALFAGIIGGTIGGIAGMATAGGMTQLYLQYFNIPLLKVDFNFGYVAIAVAMASVICTGAGLWGARGIIHITPAESMKEEHPKKGKRIFLENIPFLWKRFSFSWKLVFKNIFRSKKRTGLVIAGVIFTYGMILFTLSMPAVVDNLMNKYFTDYLKMDYSVSFKMPMDKSVVYDFKGMGKIDAIEVKADIPVELSNGNLKKIINLTAVNQDTQFYGFADNDGNSIAMPEQGLMLTENLAGILKVKPGDWVKVKSYSGGDPVYEKVVVVFPQSLGMGAYTNFESLNRFLLGKNLITGVNIKSGDTALANEILKARNIASVSSSTDIRAMYDKSLALIIVSIGIMLVFSGVLGFSIVYNVTSVNIGEREAEFSTLRVLGFSNKEIFRLILKENNIIMVIGILLGIPVGTAMLGYATYAFSTENYSLKMEPTSASLFYAGMTTILFILLAQVATYRRIKKLDFLQALKTRI